MQLESFKNYNCKLKTIYSGILKVGRYYKTVFIKKNNNSLLITIEYLTLFSAMNHSFLCRGGIFYKPPMHAVRLRVLSSQGLCGPPRVLSLYPILGIPAKSILE
jgi:hypothetical protein